jgi:uracil phosphoribosyltransferase
LKETPEMFSGLFWTGDQAVQLGLADQMANLDYVAREVVKAEELIDYTHRDNVAERLVIVLDPMLATANSAVAAVDLLKARGCRAIRMVCLLAAPEGIAHFHTRHPEVPIWTAAIDSHLDAHGYIVPGLGDAGDRIFGTR